MEPEWESKTWVPRAALTQWRMAGGLRFRCRMSSRRLTVRKCRRGVTACSSFISSSHSSRLGGSASPRASGGGLPFAGPRTPSLPWAAAFHLCHFLEAFPKARYPISSSSLHLHRWSRAPPPGGHRCLAFTLVPHLRLCHGVCRRRYPSCWWCTSREKRPSHDNS